MSFKPGDRAICVRPHEEAQDFFNPQKKGQHVIVTGVMNCPACGAQKVATGTIYNKGIRVWCDCGEPYLEAGAGDEAYLHHNRYAKAIEKTEYIAVAVDVKIEEPALN